MSNLPSLNHTKIKYGITLTKNKTPQNAIKKIKTNIAQLVHQADMIATRFEMERYMFGDDANIPYADILGIDKDEPRIVDDAGVDVESGKSAMPSKTIQKAKPKVNKMERIVHVFSVL